jgi:dimethylamine monooxygenase subunit A
MLLTFDFDAAVAAPFRMQPGLRRLADGSAQLTPLLPGSRHQREKLAVLTATPLRALAAEPGFDPTPALRAVCAHAMAEHPQAWAWDDRRASALLLGVAVQGDEVLDLAPGVFGLGDEVGRCLRALPPASRLAGLLCLAFAEDFAVIDGPRAVIAWIAACLPSHWAPAEKVGKHFAQVHAPVADNATLLKAGEHLMRLVCEPQRWERFVWTVTRHPRLNAHPDAVDPALWAADAFANKASPSAWFRSERQTFLPLPEHQQAVFTIATDCVPLAEALHTPQRAAVLHDAIATMSEAVLAYRSLTAVREPLLAWLRQQAAT